MPDVNLEQANFHEVVNDAVAVFMTDLVKEYEDIHVFVEHPVNELVELPVEDLESLAARQPGSELEGVNALEVFVGDQQNEDVIYCVSSDCELQSDHFYEYAEYEEDNENENDDGEYRANFSQFGGHDNAKTTNVDHGEQVWARRAGKALVVDDQVEERSEGEGSDLEEEPQMQPIDVGEDSTDS